MASPSPFQNLRFRLSSGPELDVRSFRVDERLGAPFVVELVTRSPDPDLDLEGFVGEGARFDVSGHSGRGWVGVIRAFEQVLAEPSGLSTYRVELVPQLWLLTQRRNHRMFQRMTEPEIVLELLSDWKIAVDPRLDTASYKKRDYRVQYAESDFAFMSRMLEDAGITYWFDTVGEESRMVLSDAPQATPPRAPIAHEADPTQVVDREFVTGISVVREVKPGKYTVRDVDFRIPPDYPLLSSSSAKAKQIESQLESFHYVPGAFLFEGQSGGTPSADSKLSARTSEREGELLATRRLDAKRSESRTYSFQTNVVGLKPGMRLPIVGHARSELGAAHPVLISETSLAGTVAGEWSISCRAKRGDAPFRPALSTPKPKVSGVETATVVGAEGDEIHTDEFGRIRVHFHWDRDSRMNDDSSCWVPVSHPWAGTGFGGMNIPRVGQEVVVDFLSGDPDRPIILGRVYTASQPVPFKLPDNKTQSGWKSNSTTGSGGYNEMMFEDSVGNELLRMQAEKDMHTLVKNDEARTVQNDRTKKILRDETSHIGRDRTETVGHDETITIGNDRTERVIANESLTVQGNRSRAVNANEDVFIGENYSRHVVDNASDTVGANASQVVSGNRNAQVGGSDATTVEQTRSASIGISDATTVGLSYSISVAPGGAPLGSYQMFPGKTEITTGQGATITMEGSRITLKADTIFFDAKNIFGAASEEISFGATKGVTMGSASGQAKVNGKTLVLHGDSTAELTSGGATTVSGTPVQLNGPGLFAGRVTELAPATITTGAALVVIGGASFPFPVVRLPDGSLKIGDHIIIKPGNEIPDFQNKTLRDLGIMSSTPAGLGRLNNLQNNPGGHNVTISEYTAADAKNLGANNSYAIPTGDWQKSYLTRDAKGNPIPNSGADSDLHYNPDIALGPNGREAEPPDATLFHELGHTEHNAYGVDRQGEKMGDGWTDREEWQNIEGGVNKPGGANDIPGSPQSPSENDYLGDRNYPYRRGDHGGKYLNPDGTVVKDPP